MAKANSPEEYTQMRRLYTDPAEDSDIVLEHMMYLINKSNIEKGYASAMLRQIDEILGVSRLQKIRKEDGHNGKLRLDDFKKLAQDMKSSTDNLNKDQLQTLLIDSIIRMLAVFVKDEQVKSFKRIVLEYVNKTVVNSAKFDLDKLFDSLSTLDKHRWSNQTKSQTNWIQFV